MSTPSKNTWKMEDVFREIRTLNQRGINWDLSIASTLNDTFPAGVDTIYGWGLRIYDKFQVEFNARNGSIVHQMECFMVERYEFKRNIISNDLLWRETGRNQPWSICSYNDVWRIMHHNIGYFKTTRGAPKIGISDVVNLLESSFVQQIGRAHV